MCEFKSVRKLLGIEKLRLFSSICLNVICHIPTKKGLRDGTIVSLVSGQAPLRRTVQRIVRLLF